MSGFGERRVWSWPCADGMVALHPSPAAEDDLQNRLDELTGFGSCDRVPVLEGEVFTSIVPASVALRIPALLPGVEFTQVHGPSDLPRFGTAQAIGPLLLDHHVARACSEVRSLPVPHDEMRRILLADADQLGMASAAARLVRWYPKPGEGMDTADRGYVLDAVATDLTEGKHDWPTIGESLGAGGDAAQRAIVERGRPRQGMAFRARPWTETVAIVEFAHRRGARCVNGTLVPPLPRPEDCLDAQGGGGMAGRPRACPARGPGLSSAPVL